MGEGEYALHLNAAQLELITAYLNNTILGDSGYKGAAFDLALAIEKKMGPDFFDHSTKQVMLCVNTLDKNGVIIDTIDGCDAAIEVKE
jgi:hypothetical protein